MNAPETPSDDTLRAALTHGSPAERVHAAWELALRLGRDSIASLEQRLATDTNDGARRHLLVVLAGLGERDVVRVVAEHDPNPLVRATAAVAFARTAATDDERDVWLAARLADPSLDVISAVLDLTPTPSGPRMRRAIEHLLGAADLALRSRAADHVSRAPDDVELTTLLALARLEADDALALRLAELAIRRDARAIARLDAQLARRVLQLDLDRSAVTWGDLAPLMNTEVPPAPDDAMLLLDCFEGRFDAIPRASLLRLLAAHPWRGLHPNVLDPLLERCEVVPLTEEERTCLRILVHELDAWAEEYLDTPSWIPERRTALRRHLGR